MSKTMNKLGIKHLNKYKWPQEPLEQNYKLYVYTYFSYIVALDYRSYNLIQMGYNEEIKPNPELYQIKYQEYLILLENRLDNVIEAIVEVTRLDYVKVARLYKFATINMKGFNFNKIMDNVADLIELANDIK